MANGNGDKTSLRVLVVEDNEDLAALIREQLWVYKCEIVTYSSNFEQLLAEEPWQNIDAALIDMWLTRTDTETGFPTAFSILTYLEEKFPEVMRVVYSAIPQQLLIHEGIRVQQVAHYVFTKPMNTEELVEALRG